MIISLKAFVYKAFRDVYGKIWSMNQYVRSLPDNPKELKDLVLQLQAKVDHQSHYIDQLIEAIALAKHQHFGPCSEKFNPESDQLSLLFNEAEVLADHDTKQSDSHDEATKTKVSGYIRKKSKGGRKPLPEHLPRIEVVHELAEGDYRCDHC